MTSDEALANLQAAMRDYGEARKSLAYHRGLAKHGIANSMQLAFAAEHSAFHRLERAQAEYSALQPAPHSVPKPVTTAPNPAPVVAPAVAAEPTTKPGGKFDLLGFLNDRCEASESRVRARYGLSPLPKSRN